MASTRTSRTTAARKTKAAAAKAPEAAAGALGFALHGFGDGNPEEVAGKLNDLATLCDRAADHMSLAHSLLSTHELHTETAIGHLDAALTCLQQISEEGKAPKPQQQRAVRAAKTA